MKNAKSLTHISCEDVFKIYKIADLEVVALRGLDLEVESGEMIAIVGASGSGKSTLGNAILNVIQLTAPDVKIRGDIKIVLNDQEIELSRLTRKEIKPYRQYIQMIFQDPYSSLNAPG